MNPDNHIDPVPLDAAGESTDADAAERARRLERIENLGRMMARVAEMVSSPDPARFEELPASEPLMQEEGALLERLQQLEAMIRQLLICVRGGDLERQPQPLAGLVAQFARSLAPRLAATGSTLAISADEPDTEVLCHPQALTTMLQAIAESWLARGARIDIRVGRGREGSLRLECRRVGPGGFAPALVLPLAEPVAAIVARTHEAELEGDLASGQVCLRVPTVLDPTRDAA
ncbi:hypothetical protein [Plasticicumulans acidivorans]|uniref:Uncharacterized protein n=1 Tax=Plasticicumulans acidivorans TaxID=886464 RepID=A0A317MXN8_9GAMM|nr:hypothetical protein [Plasticicumulans acidivorans]PWV63284.1 hypothetical protein C7443_103209 [Plasticicumulans acidivorans]